MPLNIVSNLAASVANRALTMADRDYTTSLRKLSSGMRVESARDDAASMAIGSRLRGELAALKTVSTNAAQGIAVFQIAEGGMARIYDILVRLKALASQAGSSQLSNTERGMLDTEYQAMKSEIDRLAGNTTFNGNSLINANVTITKNGMLNNAASVIDFAVGGFNTNSAQFNAASDANSNVVFTLSQDASQYLTGSLSSNQLTSGAATLASGAAVRLTAGSSNISDKNAYAIISFVGGINFLAATQAASVTIASTSVTNFAFKVGTSGIATNDQISLNVRGANRAALGLTNSDITTQARADSAAAAVTEAINAIVISRSEVGAVQNRLDSAQTNISTIMENIEAARSSYLDLDVAAEMATFTSKQILVQAGVSMLSQAKQAPEALLKLFQ